MSSFSAELVQRTTLSPRVVGLTFLASRPFTRLAGQYVTLTLGDGVSHAFSIATPFDAEAPARFELAAARGTTAEALLQLPVGSVVGANGPSGKLVWQGESPALFVAAGTGIAPLRALIREELARASASPLHLLFGCRDRTEELWGDEWRQLESAQPRFQFWSSHSQPLPDHAGRVGRVQAHLMHAARALGPGLRAYVCGHKPMVAECASLLLANGATQDRVFGESY